MTARACPACARRYTMVIAPDCPICAGAGTLTLGRTVAQYGAETVSRSVELTLELAARDVMAAGGTIDQGRAALSAAVANLRRVGLLGTEPTRPPAGRLTVDVVNATAAALTDGYRPDLPYAVDAPPLTPYRPDDRPHAAGTIPGFSNAGYISSMTRVSDPLDIATRSTQVHAAQTARTEQRATILADAATRIQQTRKE